MKSQKYELDMTTGSITKSVFRFSIPLILGSTLQLLYNAADIVVVGRWAGSNATASVGSTGSLCNLFICVFMGISMGVSVVVSKAYGSRNYDKIHKAVNTSVLMSVIMGIIAMILGLLLSKEALKIIGTPEGEVFDGALLYMRIFFLGVPASMAYNFGSAILRAFGDTKRPVYILACTGIVNVVLNLIFVIIFHMGVAGVAIATAVANYLSAGAIILILTRSDTAYKINIRKLTFHKNEFKEIIQIGLPAGLQSSVFSLSNTVIQSAVNSFGTAAMAGCAAGASIEGFVYTGMIAFSQASVTAVSQNYGAKNEKRIKKSILVSLMWITIVGLTLGIISVLFANPLLKLYIPDSPDAIYYGRMRMIITGLPYFLCGIMDVLGSALRGLGHSTIGAINSLFGVCGSRLLWIIFVLPLWRSIGVLFLCWPISWILVGLMQFAVLAKNFKKDMTQMQLQ